MSDQPVYEHTRPVTDVPSLAGSNVTVSASVGRDDRGESWVSIKWERDDLTAKGKHPTFIALTLEEFQGIATGIVDALDQPDAARRTHAPTDGEQTMASAAHFAATNPQHFDHDPYSREGFDDNGDPVYPKG